jgi:hypothetical protein
VLSRFRVRGNAFGALFFPQYSGRLLAASDPRLWSPCHLEPGSGSDLRAIRGGI